MKEAVRKEEIGSTAPKKSPGQKS